jgi:hypothetical protein
VRGSVTFNESHRHLSEIVLRDSTRVGRIQIVGGFLPGPVRAGVVLDRHCSPWKRAAMQPLHRVKVHPAGPSHTRKSFLDMYVHGDPRHAVPPPSRVPDSSAGPLPVLSLSLFTTPGWAAGQPSPHRADAVGGLTLRSVTLH